MTRGSSSGADSALERLLFEALERRAVGGDAALAQFLAEHPKDAGALRAELENLARVGMLSTPGAEGERPPERLGDFRLLRILGEGGMGVVWEAEQISLSRPVALKLVRPEHVWFPGARERFRREVEAIARLQHAGIVPVYTVGEEQGVPYFAMERLDGSTLADVLARLRGRDPADLSGADLARALDEAAPPSDARSRGALFEGTWIDACLRIAREVAEALEHAHSRGIVHRDVKPSNVALTRTGRAMLFDFGLARSGKADRLTRSGSQPGSLPYMSPEQVQGESDVDGRTDVYSLGATLYEMLTLRPAFESPSSEVLRSRIASGEIVRPSRLNRRLAWDVETLVLTAMERDPARRYPSAGDLARDLGNLLAHRPIEARRPGVVLRILRWGQRHPGASAALLAAAPLALAGLVAVAWTEARGRRMESELRSQAEEEREKVLRLSDLRRISDLQREAASLWPAEPDRERAYEAWLDRARDVSARLDLHRATLAGMTPPAQGSIERGSAPRTEEIERAWHYDTLASLIRSLEDLQQPERGLVADVERRLQFARTVEERSRSGPQASTLWTEAVSSIADPAPCPAYGGRPIDPQLGLLPIGRDPGTGLWEFAHLQTGEPPRRDAEGRIELREESGVVFVLLPGGIFRMGRPSEPSDPDYDPLFQAIESPAHEIDLAPFFVSKYLITQAQWLRITGANPSALAPGGGVRGITWLDPVENVSWNEAVAVLGRLGLELPTETQWEYAARAGTSTPWWTGADRRSVEGAANLADQSLRRETATEGLIYEDWLDDGLAHHSPVDRLRANPFGLHDVIGNVMQWCRDVYGSYQVPAEPGTGLRSPDGNLRILRGGSYGHAANMARSSARDMAPPDFHAFALGVRPVRALR